MSLKIVETQFGTVEGIRSGIPTVIAFRGIPFAAPPVGPLRWRAPVPPAPWKGVRKCFEYAPVCMQEKRDPSSFAAKEFYAYQPPCSEDSLYLNLWTPAESPDDRLPVMVYLYGGANTQGYSCKMEADGDMLAKQGVIYVCAAYRLGIFGFLAHPALSKQSGCGSGNYGLLDQIAALRWVHDNIAAFGGDPENVTLFGQSAGGVDLQTLLCSPLAAGLFHRAISQSAGGLLPVLKDVPLSEAEHCGLLFQEAADCPSLEALRALSAEQILNVAASAPAGAPYAHGMLPICVDGYVLPKSMPDALAQGDCMDIPLIVGCTSDEGLAGFTDPAPASAAAALQKRIKDCYGPYAGPAKKLYPAPTPQAAIEAYRRVWGDAMFLGCLLWASSRNRRGSKTFVYYFNRQLPDADGISRSGAFHSADLWYTFGNFYRSWRPMIGADFTLAAAMNRFWTHFARTGDPNEAGLPDWPAFSSDHPTVMLLGERIGTDALSSHPVMRLLRHDILQTVEGSYEF